jgi:hypothetical protein
MTPKWISIVLRGVVKQSLDVACARVPVWTPGPALQVLTVSQWPQKASITSRTFFPYGRLSLWDSPPKAIPARGMAIDKVPTPGPTVIADTKGLTRQPPGNQRGSEATQVRQVLQLFSVKVTSIYLTLGFYPSGTPRKGMGHTP